MYFFFNTDFNYNDTILHIFITQKSSNNILLLVLLCRKQLEFHSCSVEEFLILNSVVSELTSWILINFSITIKSRGVMARFLISNKYVVGQPIIPPLWGTEYQCVTNKYYFKKNRLAMSNPDPQALFKKRVGQHYFSST